jgi:hypothetical protein
MENIKTNGFAEMSVSEMQKVDGGSLPINPVSLIPPSAYKYIVAGGIGAVGAWAIKKLTS